MRLFKRNEPKVEEIVEIPEAVINYTDFQTALIGEFSDGSNAAKKLTFKTDADEIIVFTDGTHIKYAYSKGSPLLFSERLYWVLEDELSAVKREQISAPNHDFADPESYAKALNKNPEAKPTVDGILREYTISVLIQASNIETFTEFESEVLTEPESTTVNNFDFFEKTVDDVYGLIVRIKEDENTYLSTLNEQRDESITIGLEGGTLTHEPINDVEKLIISAGEAGSTISDLREASSGFVFADVLKNLVKMNEENLVKVEVVEYEENYDADYGVIVEEDYTEPVEEVEPEVVVNPLDAMLEDIQDDEVSEDDWVFEYPPVEEAEKSDEFTFESESDNTDYSSYFGDNTAQENPLLDNTDEYGNPLEDDTELPDLPVDEIELPALEEKTEDDGGFDYEELEEEDVIGFTGKLDDRNFEQDFERVLEHDEVTSEDADKVRGLLWKNKQLEDTVLELEASIFDLQASYRSEIWGNDDPAVGIVAENPASHEIFFKLYDVEEMRAIANAKRAGILKELATALEPMPGDYVQEMIHRVTLKLEGIKSVVNIAFEGEVPVEDESISEVEEDAVTDEESVEEAETMEEVEEEIVSPALPRVIPTNVPIFDALVAQFGFNPLEELDKSA